MNDISSVDVKKKMKKKNLKKKKNKNENKLIWNTEFLFWACILVGNSMKSKSFDILAKVLRKCKQLHCNIIWYFTWNGLDLPPSRSHTRGSFKQTFHQIKQFRSNGYNFNILFSLQIFKTTSLFLNLFFPEMQIKFIKNEPLCRLYRLNWYR